jgi:hypothetical protein
MSTLCAQQIGSMKMQQYKVRSSLDAFIWANEK